MYETHIHWEKKKEIGPNFAIGNKAYEEGKIRLGVFFVFVSRVCEQYIVVEIAHTPFNFLTKFVEILRKIHF